MNQSTSAVVRADASWSRVCPLRALQKDVSRCEALINQTLQIPSDHTVEQKLNAESRSNQTERRSGCLRQIIKKPHLHVFCEAVELCYAAPWRELHPLCQLLRAADLPFYELLPAPLCLWAIIKADPPNFLPLSAACSHLCSAPRCVLSSRLQHRFLHLPLTQPSYSPDNLLVQFLSSPSFITSATQQSSHGIQSEHSQANFRPRLKGRSRLSTMRPRKAVVILKGSEMFVRTEAWTQARASHRISVRVSATCTRRCLYQLNDARVTLQHTAATTAVIIPIRLNSSSRFISLFWLKMYFCSDGCAVKSWFVKKSYISVLFCGGM